MLYGFFETVVQGTLALPVFVKYISRCVISVTSRSNSTGMRNWRSGIYVTPLKSTIKPTTPSVMRTTRRLVVLIVCEIVVIAEIWECIPPVTVVITENMGVYSTSSKISYMFSKQLNFKLLPKI